MARHKSAEKRARQSIKRQTRNSSIIHRVKNKVRAFREALGEGDKAKVDTALVAATKELQKAATKGVLHKRNAARRVSRLVLAFNKAATQA